MIAPPEFALRSASNPSRLMDEPEKFIVSWLARAAARAIG
jgi:hypothetical protein